MTSEKLTDNHNLMNEVIQWGLSYLATHGYLLKNNFPENVQNTPWSSVVRFATSGGYIYLKATPKLLALEAPIIQILHGQFYAAVPKMIAYNAELNCFLMEDAGERLRGVLKRKFDEALICKAINKFTLLQLSVADRLDIFLEMAVPDWRLDKLPALYAQLLSCKDMLREDGLTETEITQLENSSTMVEKLCMNLSGYNIKQSIVQPDFNDNNILIDHKTQDITIIDLGEITISHPFFSLLNCMQQIKKHYALSEEDDIYLRIKDACLKNYLYFETKNNLLAALRIASILFFVYSALANYRLMLACDKTKFTPAFQMQGRPGISLRGFISAYTMSYGVSF
jgi:hypothetical protein